MYTYPNEVAGNQQPTFVRHTDLALGPLPVFWTFTLGSPYIAFGDLWIEICSEILLDEYLQGEKGTIALRLHGQRRSILRYAELIAP